MMKNANSAAKKQCETRKLYEQKIEAVREGNLEAEWAIDDKLFYAQLDPDDPNYEYEVREHQKDIRLRNGMMHALAVLQANGQPLTEADIFFAIDEAVDAALKRFEHIACPKHAADLLGLVKCQSLFVQSQEKSGEEASAEEDDD